MHSFSLWCKHCKPILTTIDNITFEKICFSTTYPGDRIPSSAAQLCNILRHTSVCTGKFLSFAMYRTVSMVDPDHGIGVQISRPEIRCCCGILMVLSATLSSCPPEFIIQPSHSLFRYHLAGLVHLATHARIAFYVHLSLTADTFIGYSIRLWQDLPAKIGVALSILCYCPTASNRQCQTGVSAPNNTPLLLYILCDTFGAHSISSQSPDLQLAKGDAEYTRRS